jgi:hypothetical protein
MNQIQLPIRRPLLPIPAVMAILDRNEDKVLQLVQSGKLAWAFDLRAPRAQRACIRICTQSVQDMLSGQRSLGNGEDLQAFIDYAFPYHGETVQAVRLARVFNCGTEHIRNLVLSSALKESKAGSRGANNSPEIWFSSVVAFLKARRF